MTRVVLAYVPVLHAGYREFFRRHSSGGILYIFGEELVAEFDHLSKEIRALSPLDIKLAVESWQLSTNVAVADLETLFRLNQERAAIIMPDEDISHDLAQKYLPGCDVAFDSVFLRWDRWNTIAKKDMSPNVVFSENALDHQLMGLAVAESERSSDWWRRVGALAARDGEVLAVAFNRHLPSPHMPYALGDPRNNFKRGVLIELSSANHAEAEIICIAASTPGLSLEGASLYVTTFPCPPCAKLVARSGFKRLFFREGYGVLDAELILKASGIEIIRVE